jgi:hypothetical protein
MLCKIDGRLSIQKLINLQMVVTIYLSHCVVAAMCNGRQPEYRHKADTLLTSRVMATVMRYGVFSVALQNFSRLRCKSDRYAPQIVTTREVGIVHLPETLLIGA